MADPLIEKFDYLDNQKNYTDFEFKFQNSEKFYVSIKNVSRLNNWISIAIIALNECEGSLLIFNEDLNYQDLFNCYQKLEMAINPCDELVLPLDDVRAKDAKLSGQIGAYLANIMEVKDNFGVEFDIPKGIIITINSYKLQLKNCPKIEEAIKKLEEQAWYECS